MRLPFGWTLKQFRFALGLMWLANAGLSVLNEDGLFLTTVFLCVSAAYLWSWVRS